MINVNPVDTWMNPGSRIGYSLAADVATRPQAGAVAALDAAGDVVSAAHASAVTAIGRAEIFLPPAGDPDADPDRVIVHRGVTGLFNDEVAPVTQADLFRTATLGADDATAAAPGEEGLALGPIISLHDGRVWVQIDGVS